MILKIRLPKKLGVGEWRFSLKTLLHLPKWDENIVVF
jgi:hypothetical protein